MKRRIHAIRVTRQSTSGSISFDIALGAFLFITLAAFGLDLTAAMAGAISNDSACRDACRAAAQNTNSVTALAAAQTQMRVHINDGIVISQPTLTGTTTPNFVYNDFGGNPPTNTSPYVIVTTSVTVNLPVPVLFFSKVLVNNRTLLFTRRYQFPIIRENYYG